MHWKNEKYDQFQKQEAERMKVIQNAESIYKGLWDAIQSNVREAKTASIFLKPNGAPLHHTISLNTLELKIDLSEDKHSIVTSSDSGKVQLHLIVRSEDEPVSLEHQGKSVTYTEAARLVMEPFLFSGSSPYALKA